MQRLPDSHSVIHSFIHSVGQSFRQSTGRLDRQSLQKKKKKKQRKHETYAPGSEKEREKRSGGEMAPKTKWQPPKLRKTTTQYGRHFVFSPLCWALCSLSLCLFLPVRMYFYVFRFGRFFFVYVEASSFHFSLGRVGAVATSSPKNPPPLRKPSFGFYFRLFTFRKLHRQTNGMKGKKKLLSRHPLDVFTRFRCQSCVNYAIKLTWMSFVQHAKQPK